MRTDGSTEIKGYDMTSGGIRGVTQDKFIVGNQDIFCGSERVFSRNHGYEYDATHESEKICNDVIKTKNNMFVYEKPALNYNPISTLTAGSMLKRINKDVNEANGHSWDKVRLSNGVEGYIFSDNLETVTEYENINFAYKGRSYDIYFWPTDRTLEEYLQYVVTQDSLSQILICYNNANIRAVRKNNAYDLFSSTGYLITVRTDGSTEIKGYDMTLGGIRGVTQDRYIASNQDIYYGSELIFAKKEANNRYGYDKTKEEEPELKDIMSVSTKRIIYESPSIQSKQLGILEVGDVVRRTHKAVIQLDGHSWDKIKLANGKYGYIFAEDLEKETNYENLKFQFNKKKYEVYFTPSKHGIDLEKYPYYMIGIDDETSAVTICYSKSEIEASAYKVDEYRNYGSTNAFKIVVNKDGTTSKNIFDMSLGIKIHRNKYIESNRDIYDGNIKIFNACVYDQDGKIAYTTGGSWDDIKMREDAYNPASKRRKRI